MPFSCMRQVPGNSARSECRIACFQASLRIRRMALPFDGYMRFLSHFLSDKPFTFTMDPRLRDGYWLSGKCPSCCTLPQMSMTCSRIYWLFRTFCCAPTTCFERRPLQRAHCWYGCSMEAARLCDAAERVSSKRCSPTTGSEYIIILGACKPRR